MAGVRLLAKTHIMAKISTWGNVVAAATFAQHRRRTERGLLDDGGAHALTLSLPASFRRHRLASRSCSLGGCCRSVNETAI